MSEPSLEPDPNSPTKSSFTKIGEVQPAASQTARFDGFNVRSPSSKQLLLRLMVEKGKNEHKQ
jgi:hypothetical protein